ncbi:hypothetical protein BH23CHL1_BH23CHL1_10410 [soil metagenome]
MATEGDSLEPRPSRRKRVDVHVHRDSGYDEYDYVDEPTPGEIAAAASFSIIQAILLVILVVLVAVVIASLLGAVSVLEIVDDLRNLGRGTNTPAS